MSWLGRLVAVEFQHPRICLVCDECRLVAVDEIPQQEPGRQDFHVTPYCSRSSVFADSIERKAIKRFAFATDVTTLTGR